MSKQFFLLAPKNSLSKNDSVFEKAAQLWSVHVHFYQQYKNDLSQILLKTKSLIT